MRIINTEVIKEAVGELFLEANVSLPVSVAACLEGAVKKEESALGRDVLEIINKNIALAKRENMSLCQDTGMAIVFLQVGQEVFFEGEDINEAVNEGVRRAYHEGFFRKSVVSCPLRRKNTGDNTPAIIYYSITKGDKVKIRVMPKGFGSENCGKTCMLKPSQGEEGVIDFVLEAVREAGSKPCPPIVVGVGMGGSMEKASLLAKEALFEDITRANEDEYLRELELKLLEKINNLGIGPAGLGGRITALGVKILTYPTHIAGLPVAVNIGCYALRHGEKII